MSEISRKSLILSVNQKYGNIIISWLRDQNLIDSEFKINSSQSILYVPIKFIPKGYKEKKNQYNLELYPLDSMEIQQYVEKRGKKKKNSLKDLIKSIVPSKFEELIPRSFDIVGRIAIIEINREEHTELRPYISEIGKILLSNNPNLDSVYEKAGNIDGLYRTRQFNHVAGKKSTITQYKENHCNFLIDIEKTFFTPRLAFERNRIANLETEFNSKGIIWDMFCGIGPYLIQIARKTPNSEFIGTDINPDAINLAKSNIPLNKLRSKIQFYNYDVAHIEDFPLHKKLEKNVSRIIMNLPEKNLDFLEILPPYICPEGCLLHIYQFNEKRCDPLKEARDKLEMNLRKENLTLKNVIGSRIVKPFSPALETTVIDAIISK